MAPLALPSSRTRPVTHKTALSPKTVSSLPGPRGPFVTRAVEAALKSDSAVLKLLYTSFFPPLLPLLLPPSSPTLRQHRPLSSCRPPHFLSFSDGKRRCRVSRAKSVAAM